VFSSRPAKVKEIVEINLPAERSLKMKHTTQFLQLQQQIWRLIDVEAARVEPEAVH